MDNLVSFEEARLLALEAARDELGMFSSFDKLDVLSNFYIEAEGCWFFFKADEIEFPGGKNIIASGVYAVSKHGKLNYVYDFRDNEQQMKEYVDMFSLHSLGKGDEANAAWTSFKAKYNLE